jgi:hypothetical protein
VSPTPDPVFGGSFRAAGAGGTFVLADGRGSRPLPPGRYRVLVTRGPEYDLLDDTVDVPPGGAGRTEGTLVRRVETAGHLAADLHVHTAASTDAGTPPHDRALACAAEGVDVVVAADHNAATDLSAAIRDRGLDPWLAAVAGVEITTDLSRTPIGHVNAFPVAVDPGGATVDPVPWLDLSFPEIVAGIRRVPGALAQVSHPRSPMNGTFALLGFRPADGTATGPFTADVDLVEVANGLGFEQTAAATADWAALVRCGRRIVPVGGSDAHALAAPPCGFARTWVFAGRDSPAGLGAEAFASAVRSGRVVVSTGPFVALRVGDVPSGGTAATTLHGVLVQLRVEAAPWVDVRRVRVLVNGAEAQSLVPTARAPEPVRLETQQLVPLTGDAVIWVEASGDDPLPTLDPASPIRPWALTGPVWVDTDGDGAVKPQAERCPAP